MTGVTSLQAGSEPVTGSATPHALPGVWAAAGAVLCGVFYFLAFPGIDLWPLGFIALVPLRVAPESRLPPERKSVPAPLPNVPTSSTSRAPLLTVVEPE